MVKLTVHEGGGLNSNKPRDLKKEVLRLYTQKLRKAVEPISPYPVVFEMNQDPFEIYRISIEKEEPIKYGIIDNLSIGVYIQEIADQRLTPIQIYNCTGLNLIVETLRNQAVFDYCISKFQRIKILNSHAFQTKFKNGKKELQIPIIQVVRLKPPEALDQIMSL